MAKDVGGGRCRHGATRDSGSRSQGLGSRPSPSPGETSVSLVTKEVGGK